MVERFRTRETDETRELKERNEVRIEETDEKPRIERSEEFRKGMEYERDLQERFDKAEEFLEELCAAEKIRESNLEKIEFESHNETLGYLVGALRDGSVYYDSASRNYFTMFYQKHREWLEDSIGERVEKEFDQHYSIEEYKPGHYRLKMSSKELYDMWRDTYEFPKEGIGQGSWGVPEEIKSDNTHVKAHFIRGVFDTEGDVSPESSKTNYVGISQKNTEFLEDIREMLEEMDIHPGKTHVIDNESETCRIAISEKKSLHRFITLIGSEHPEKARKLHEIQSLLEQDT